MTSWTISFDAWEQEVAEEEHRSLGMSGDNQLGIKPIALTADAGSPSLLEVGLGLANSHTTEFSVKRNYKGHPMVLFIAV